MEYFQFAFHGQEPADISELVYDSLHGFLIPACHLPWVEMIFHPGHPCYDAYEEMCCLRDQICKRLGSGQEDRELVEMTDSMMDYSKAITLEMFNYGRKFQKMLDNEENEQGTPDGVP